MITIRDNEKLLSVCKCGCVMPFKATIIMTNVKKKCPYCGREYFEENPTIDWEKAIKLQYKAR